MKWLADTLKRHLDTSQVINIINWVKLIVKWIQTTLFQLGYKMSKNKQGKNFRIGLWWVCIAYPVQLNPQAVF